MCGIEFVNMSAYVIISSHVDQMFMLASIIRLSRSFHFFPTVLSLASGRLVGIYWILDAQGTVTE